jgi:threonine synthase
MTAMQFLSTRREAQAVGLVKAIHDGLAPDGGLYIPESFPNFTPACFDRHESMADIGVHLLTPFFEGTELESALPKICSHAFAFPIPLRACADPQVKILELFHGPTAAFKDVGARFLASCLEYAKQPDDAPLTVLVATSGDTGGAVAGAFEDYPSTQVAILYPAGMVSARQEHQLCCWPPHIRSFKVAGTFDDCQRIVKEAFADPSITQKLRLTSANSISIARLLPQMVYYASSSLQHWRETGSPANYIIPAGNLGNSLACIWARHMGLPIGHIALATNANPVLSTYFQTGIWQPGQTTATLASAMDVGNPSNVERLFDLLPTANRSDSRLSASKVKDSQIRDSIADAWNRLQLELCPHTATAWQVRRWMDQDQPDQDWILVATAHPAKFEQIVEPLVGHSVPIPPALESLLQRPVERQEIEATLESFREALLEGSA